MGDFAADTEISGGDGHYRARLSEDWALWGPCGGYVATVALRAAGAHSRFDAPASFVCHFLSVADFADVDLETTTLRAGRRGESVQVTMTQGDRPICHALLWTVHRGAGFEYDRTHAPDVGAPEEVPTVQERDKNWEPRYPFWTNFDYRPLDWTAPEDWPPPEPLEPRYRAWFRFIPTSAFDDPFVEAGRVALLVDIMGWPAAHRAVAADDVDRWMAPNMDMSMVLHQEPAGAKHLYLDSEASLARGGLVAASGQVWAPDGRLLASGVQQMMCREIPPEARGDPPDTR